MFRFFFVTVVALFSIKSFSQTDSAERMLCFRINEYVVNLSDTTTVVQVNLPEVFPFKFSKDQIVIMKHRYVSDQSYDTSSIGWGRCSLIKSNYYYFTIHHKVAQDPKQGELLYARLKVPVAYAGLLFKVGCLAINFTQVDESQFYHAVDIFSMTKEKESEILDSMVADIHFTGKAMLDQMPQQNLDIKGGIYDGQKLFAAMQTVKREELEKFLKYVIYIKGRYVGNIWKISETFATWMISETPAVKE